MGLEKTVQRMHSQLSDSRRAAAQEKDNLVQILHTHEQTLQCDVLYADGRILDAAVLLLEITNSMSEEARANKLIMDWFASKFWHRES